MTEQNPKPSDLTTLKNLSFDMILPRRTPSTSTPGDQLARAGYDLPATLTLLSSFRSCLSSAEVVGAFEVGKGDMSGLRRQDVNGAERGRGRGREEFTGKR